jgi:hypothetical protein
MPGIARHNIISRAPVKFYRPANIKALPRPLREEADASLLQLPLNLPNQSVVVPLLP